MICLKRIGKSNPWRLLIVLLGSSVVLVLGFTLIASLRIRDHTHTAAVVFKLPRSGSSWFTEVLNRYQDIYISKEIIQTADKTSGKILRRQMESHLNKALLAPTDKIAYKDRFIWSGRFFEDYFLHPSRKFMNNLNIVGFTLNPEHVIGVDWKSIIKEVENVRIIVYSRSNLVKAAISGIRGEELKKKCGISNMKYSPTSSQKQQDCVLSATTTITPKELISQTLRWQQRVAAFHQYILYDPVLMNLPIQFVYYEEMQEDEGATVERILRFLQTNKYSQVPAADQHYLKQQFAANTGWVKRSSDDLSDLLDNYDFLFSHFAPHAECTSFLAMLRDRNHTVFLNYASDRFREELLLCMNKVTI